MLGATSNILGIQLSRGTYDLTLAIFLLYACLHLGATTPHSEIQFNCATFRYHGLSVHLRISSFFSMCFSYFDSESMVTKGSAIETTVACFL